MRWRNELSVQGKNGLYIWLPLCAGYGEGPDHLCHGIGVLSEGGVCFRLYTKMEMYGDKRSDTVR